jgi:hypothetical protein
MIDTQANPVWEVYDEYRTARLNAKYYLSKLGSLEKKNFWLEWTLAAAAPTSAVAGLSLWQNAAGKQIWLVIAVLAACLAVYKPIGKLTERMRQMEERITKYRGLEFDLNHIARAIAEQDIYNDALRAQFSSVLAKKEQLVLSYVDPEIDEDLRWRCQEQVQRELPKSKFHIPTR